MVVTLKYYPGATPTDIPAPNVQPTQRYSVTVDNATRMGTQLTLCASLLWQGETPTPNIVTVEDSSTPYKLWYFIDTWQLLTRETFRLTATYSAALTTLHNGIGINAVCSRFSEGDGERAAVTAEPLLDAMPPYYPGQPSTLDFVNNQNGIGVVVTMATDTSGRLFSNPDVPGRPEFNITAPMNSRQPEPISFLLTGAVNGDDGFTFDDAIDSLRILVSDAGTGADIIQRIQIVPKYLLHTLDTITILNRPKEGEGVYVGVSGKALVVGASKRVYTNNMPDVDYQKAYYAGTNILIRSWGSEIASVPITPLGVLVDFGYSLSNGLNSFLVVSNGDSSPALQVPVTIPDITVIGDYYTAWYNANKDQILAQGATAALSVAGSIALAVGAVASGGSLLGPAIAVGASALNAVNTGAALNKSLNDAAHTKQVIGTSPTLPYTNTMANFLEFWSPKVPYDERRAVCSRFGYASSRILKKLPTYDNSPRRVQCYVAGALQTTAFKPNGIISVTDHNNALSSELASGFTIWYADVIGNYETDNYTK